MVRYNQVKGIKKSRSQAGHQRNDFSPTLEKYQNNSNISIFAFQVFSHKKSQNKK